MQHRSRQNTSTRSTSLSLKTMLLVAGFTLLSGITFFQTVQIEFDNQDAQRHSRVVSMIVPFNRGTVPDASGLGNYKLSSGRISLNCRRTPHRPTLCGINTGKFRSNFCRREWRQGITIVDLSFVEYFFR